MFHGSTPHGENITIYSPRGNPSRGGKHGKCSTEQPTMGTQFRCCFLGATLLRGNTVMGYSLRQPSNEGNACYDGFLGHPRKRGEHAACTPFQMHPQWGHESLHLQTRHPLIGGIQNGHPLTFLDGTTPAYAGKIAQSIQNTLGGYPRYSRFSGQPHVCGDMRPNGSGMTYREGQPLRGEH